jgi:hypothetical protein
MMGNVSAIVQMVSFPLALIGTHLRALGDAYLVTAAR